MESQGLAKKTGSSAPFTYSIVSNIGTPQYFYVFQNKSFDEECAGEYLWAPKYAKDGTQNHHWTRMQEVKKGDVIFHGYKQHVAAVSIANTDSYTADRPGELSADAWTKEGWRVDTDYFVFPHAIASKDYWDKLKLMQPDKYSPFDKNGSGNMGYLFPITKEMGIFLLDATAGKTNPGAAIPTEQEDDEIISLLSGQSAEIINSLIKQFQKKLPEILPREQELEDLRVKFVNDFNMNKLMNMKKEEYVVGLEVRAVLLSIRNKLNNLEIFMVLHQQSFSYYGKGEDTEENIAVLRSSVRIQTKHCRNKKICISSDGEKKDLDAIRM